MANKNLWRGSILVKLQALKVKPSKGILFLHAHHIFTWGKKLSGWKELKKKKN